MSSYKALYRKYRPTIFDDVVGQEHITRTLKNEVVAGHPSHAYLLVGSRGTGKTTCAKLIAKAVNCTNNNCGNPCGECDACRGIDSGAIMDVLEIDAASNNGVDNIRDLREEAVFLPTSVRYRVYIIDEAHMLSIGAVNALLKIMEEPPSHVIFILATTELHKIPATILSRCQRFDFHKIELEFLSHRLSVICQSENINITVDAINLIAKLANGGMRDAISMLELAYAYAPSQITEATVIEICGLATEDYLFSISDNLLLGNLSELYSELSKISVCGIEYDKLCGQLISHFRNLMLCSVMQDPSELIVCSSDVLKKYSKQAKTANTKRILKILNSLQTCSASLSRGGATQYELEFVLARLCENTVDDEKIDTTNTDILKKLENRISALEEKLYQLATATSENTKKATIQSKNEKLPAQSVYTEQPKQPTPLTAKELAQQAVPFDKWSEVLERLAVSNPAVKAALMDSTAFLSGGYILIDCQNAVFKQMVNSNDFTKKVIKRAVFDTVGKMYSIAPYKLEDTADLQQSNKNLSSIDELVARVEAAGISVREENLEN